MPLLFRFGSDLFADLRTLAHATAQIVQLRTANETVANGLDLLDGGGMNGEDLLNANTVRNAADGDRLFDAAMLLGDHDALEDLDTLTSAFLDLNMDADGLADLDLGLFSLELLGSQFFDEIHFCFSS